MYILFRTLMLKIVDVVQFVANLFAGLRYDPMAADPEILSY
jgi:hypothetical protein